MDIKPGADPANPTDTDLTVLSDHASLVKVDGKDWLQLQVTHGPDQVWLYTPVTELEVVDLLAAGDPDTLDTAITAATTGRSVTMATAYEGRIITTGMASSADTPLATAHQWITNPNG